MVPTRYLAGPYTPEFLLLPVYRSIGQWDSTWEEVAKKSFKGFSVPAIIHAQNEIVREYNHGINVFYENGTGIDRGLHEAYVCNTVSTERTEQNLFCESRKHHNNNFICDQRVIESTLNSWKYTRGSLEKDKGTEVGYFVKCLCDILDN